MALGSTTRPTLLERLEEGCDPLAWNDFFQCYWPLVFFAAKRRGCSDHTAEEIVQDVMAAIFEKKAVFRYDPALGRFRDWLRGVVRNKVAQRRRRPEDRLQVSAEIDELEDRASHVDAAWEAAFDQALLAFLLDTVRREVSPRTYQAFELATLGELSGAEVAAITGLSRNAVYLARGKVLRRLRELGADYRDRGPPDAMIRAVLAARPHPAIERSMSRGASRL